MTLSVQKDIHGPDWPLGLIVVPTPSTPISIMSLVDAANAYDPGTATPSTAVGAVYEALPEYTVVAQQIIFQAVKSVAPYVANTGTIYIVRKGVGSGSGNRTDSGSIVAMLQPGQSFFLSSAPLNRNVFNPYRYFIDVDSANDGCLVTLLPQ
jgi:hypothetical protein